MPWTYTHPPQTYIYLTWIYIILPWIYILHVQYKNLHFNIFWCRVLLNMKELKG